MVCAAAPWEGAGGCGRRRAPRRQRETHILDDALVHEADEAVQRLLLREPVGFGEDAEKSAYASRCRRRARPGGGGRRARALS